jgi:DNA-directed RNA polymerase-4/5 subunit 2
MATYTPSKCGFGRNKNKITVKLEKTAKGKEVLTVRFFAVTVPLVLLFYALGVKSDREMMHLVGCASDDYEMSHVLVSSLHKTEAELKDFRNKKAVWGYINLQLKKSKYPKNKNAEEVLNAHLFPYIEGHKQKAMFLGYMVNCLLSSYFGRRQIESKDDYRNKRLELAGELLSRELEILLKRFRSQMTKQIQKDLSGTLVLFLVYCIMLSCTSFFLLCFRFFIYLGRSMW